MKSRSAPAPANESLERRAFRGALWSGVNTLLMKLANIAIMVVVVRMVTPEDFGVFAVALVVHAVISSIGELGLSSCIARRDLDPQKVAPTVALLSLLSSLGLALLMALAADPVATALGAAEAAEPIRVLSLSVLLGGIFTVPGAMLVRDFRQGRVLQANAIAFLPMNTLLILMAMNGDGAMAFAWSRVAGQLITGLVMAVSVSLRYWPRLDRAEVLPVLRFGLPLAGANLLSYVLLNADYAIIAKSLGPGDLGIYMLAFTVASWSTSVLSSTINSVAMPAFSAHGPDPDKLRALLIRASALVALIAFPIGAMTVALAYPLVEVLYGAPWLAAAPVLSVLAFYGAFYSMSLLFSNLLVGTGNSVAVMVVQAVWIAGLVPLVALAVAVTGLVGAAYAHVALIVLVIIPLYLLFLRRVVSTAAKPLLTAFARPLVASTLAGAAAFWISGFTGHALVNLLAGGTLGCILYAALILPILRKLIPEAPGGKLGNFAKKYDAVLPAMRARLSIGRTSLGR